MNDTEQPENDVPSMYWDDERGGGYKEDGCLWIFEG